MLKACNITNNFIKVPHKCNVQAPINVRIMNVRLAHSGVLDAQRLAEAIWLVKLD